MSFELRHATARAGSSVLLGPSTATLRAGRVAAVVGPNGAGKSTLLSLLSGQRRPHSGRVLLDDRVVTLFDPESLGRRRAVVAQETMVAFDFTAREVCTLGRYPHRRTPSPREHAIVDEALGMAAVGHLADRSFATLSGGEKARVHLARALAQIREPVDDADRWLLLDEPTAALDLRHQHEVMRLVRRLASEDGVGVVAVLHDLNLALRYADDVLLLSAGEPLVAGTVDEVLTPARIEQVWQVPCRTANGPEGPPHFVFG